MYEKNVIADFLERQLEVYPEKVAEDAEGAEEFLEMCDARLCASKKELKAALEDAGLDTAGMSEAEIFAEATVLKLRDGRYLVLDA